MCVKSARYTPFSKKMILLLQNATEMIETNRCYKEMHWPNDSIHFYYFREKKYLTNRFVGKNDNFSIFVTQKPYHFMVISLFE